jgi:hypothetical protein
MIGYEWKMRNRSLELILYKSGLFDDIQTKRPNPTVRLLISYVGGECKWESRVNGPVRT